MCIRDRNKKADKEFNRKINDELEELYQIEKMIRPTVYFSARMKRLFNQKTYTIEIPYSILPLWQDHTKTKGDIYVFTSNDWLGHSKLGATTIDIKRRARLFSKRYNIKVDIAYVCSSYDPFNVERKVARMFSEFRVQGNTLGASNEWYKIEPEIIARQIEECRLTTPPN